MQRQAGKLKVKEYHKPFSSIDKTPLCGDLHREELGGEGAAGSAGEEDLLGFVILVSTLKDLGHRAACCWMLTLERRCIPVSRFPSFPLLDYLRELEFEEGFFFFRSASVPCEIGWEQALLAGEHQELPPVPPSYQHTPWSPPWGSVGDRCRVAKRRQGRGGKLMTSASPTFSLHIFEISVFQSGVIFTPAQCCVRSPLMDEARDQSP